MRASERVSFAFSRFWGGALGRSHAPWLARSPLANPVDGRLTRYYWLAPALPEWPTPPSAFYSAFPPRPPLLGHRSSATAPRSLLLGHATRPRSSATAPRPPPTATAFWPPLAAAPRPPTRSRDPRPPLPSTAPRLPPTIAPRLPPVTAPLLPPATVRFGHRAFRAPRRRREIWDPATSGPTSAATACRPRADVTAWLGVGPRHAEPPDRKRSRGIILFSVFEDARGYMRATSKRYAPAPTRLLPACFARRPCAHAHVLTRPCAERAAARRVLRPRPGSAAAAAAAATAGAGAAAATISRSAGQCVGTVVVVRGGGCNCVRRCRAHSRDRTPKILP